MWNMLGLLSHVPQPSSMGMPDGPKITDWIQAFGSIAAILVSSMLAIGVPIWMRYLEVRRYRRVFAATFVEIVTAIESTEENIFSVVSRVRSDIDWQTAEKRSVLKQLERTLETMPFLLADFPSGQGMHGHMLLVTQEALSIIERFARSHQGEADEEELDESLDRLFFSARLVTCLFLRETGMFFPPRYSRRACKFYTKGSFNIDPVLQRIDPPAVRHARPNAERRARERSEREQALQEEPKWDVTITGSFTG